MINQIANFNKSSSFSLCPSFWHQGLLSKFLLQVWRGVRCTHATAVTDIMQTREYAVFADRVLASHDRAYQQYAADISPVMREMLAEMQAVWQCSVRAARHDLGFIGNEHSKICFALARDKYIPCQIMAKFACFI